MVGVIDLVDGKAVHGVGGIRHQYQPTRRFGLSESESVAIDGDFLRLIECYQAVDIGSLYVADLNGIQSGRCQRDAIESIAEKTSTQASLLVDPGLSHSFSGSDWSWLQALATRYPHVDIVVATECANDVSILSLATDCLPRNRVAVSFDYKESQWLSTTTSPREWIDTCIREEIATIIGLDLAAVGSSSIKLTLSLCEFLCNALPGKRYLTGGGIRSEVDARQLVQCGADGLLVASAFTT